MNHAERSYAEFGPAIVDRVTATDAQVLKGIESRHDGLPAVPAGALDITAARDAARHDVVAMNGFTDKGLKDRAAATMGDTADQHQTYKAALIEVGPGYASLADRAFADGQQKSAAKEDRKAIEYDDRRNDAVQEIATRYANLKQAGLSVKDLQGPAVDRVAVMDSRALLLLEGQPPHAREGEARALIAESMKSAAYRATFTRETAEWTASGMSSRRQLAAAIEKALLDGKVSPEIRSRVRDMMAAEGARRMARGDRIKVPVYDARAPRARAKTISAGPQRVGDRERSR